MKKIIVVVFLFSFFTPLALKAQAQKKVAAKSGAAPSRAVMDRGKEVYMINCLACHQADGSGVPRLNPPIVNTKWTLGPKATLIQLLLKGSQGKVEIDGDTFDNMMPPVAHLTDQQIADVLTYIRNSFGNKASAVSAAEVKAVRAKVN